MTTHPEGPLADPGLGEPGLFDPGPIPAADHPEFPHSVHSRILLAVLSRLRGDELLAGFFAQIDDYHTGTLLEADTARLPALAAMLDASEETPKGSGLRAATTTVVRLAVLDEIARRPGTRSALLDRAWERIRCVLAAGLGVLQDPDGKTLTCLPVQFQRQRGARITAAGNVAVYEALVAYRSEIQWLNRRIYL